ncbi:putative MFS family arabinose efflux permease [Novosphingobium sp. PhB165]|uniref:MFS transporter n=1 Tax=Novosphingobium sp. PhB165 TaxID=2485105 RepID=UPI00104BF144|nr:MFS transporter [Novosphingobium sp. PhB165]TCM20781.1 putative MFS family arabinose efflux permease [Novosphingobium sp. PhB165]
MNQPRHPFSFPAFRLFWVARLCTTMAQGGMVVVLGWQVYEVARATRSIKEAAFQLGIVGLVQFIPLFLLVLVTGWTADHIDRRVIARLCSVVQLGCALLLGWLNTGHPGAGHGVTLGALFAVAAMFGIVRAFAGPALNALAPDLVPADVLPRAIATNAIASRLGAIIGPASVGFLYDAGPVLPYAVAAGLFTLCLGCLMAIGPVPRSKRNAALNPWQQMIEGVAYVRYHPLILGAISLDLMAVLLGGATALLPVFAHDILMIGPSGLGTLRAAPALGAMLSAFWFSWRPLDRGVGTKMLAAVAVYGVAIVGFGISRWLPLSLLCLTVSGAADMFSVYVRQSLIQLSTPQDMRGRVGAVSSLFISASNELGEAESGFVAALIGPVATVIVGGFGAIAVTMIWSRLFPALRQAHSFDIRPFEPARK